MRVNRKDVAWWSPDPRGVIPLDGLYVSKSLRKSMRRFELRVDTSFEAVMRGVRRPEPARRAGSTTRSSPRTRALFDLGWVH